MFQFPRKTNVTPDNSNIFNDSNNIFLYNQLGSGPSPQSYLYSQDFQGSKLLNGCFLVWPNKQVLSVFQWPIRNLQSLTKYLGQTLVFMSYSALWEKFKFCFCKDFYWHWKSFHFGRRTKHYAIILQSFEIFLIFPNFLRFFFFSFVFFLFLFCFCFVLFCFVFCLFCFLFVLFFVCFVFCLFCFWDGGEGYEAPLVLFQRYMHLFTYVHMDIRVLFSMYSRTGCTIFLYCLLGCALWFFLRGGPVRHY